MSDEFLYRCESIIYAAPLDEFDRSSGEGRLELREIKFQIIKRTPKGAWIDIYGDKKFVNLTARKKFACETIDKALESFIARKERQISILESQTRYAKRVLQMAKIRRM